MSNKVCRIDVEGQQHSIELKTASFSGGGNLSLDGKEIKKWGASLTGLPLPMKLEVQGKPAEIKQKGFLRSAPVLFIDGKEVPLGRDSLTISYDEDFGATLRIGQPNKNESYAYFKGLMDELQISAISRGADWIKLSYMNQRKENSLVKQ